MRLLNKAKTYCYSQKLALIANEVSAIGGLDAQGPSLQHLELYQNKIKKIENIQHLGNLRYGLRLPQALGRNTICGTRKVDMHKF